MTVPAAIGELLVRYFGGGSRPNYSETVRAIDREAYSSLRKYLEADPVVKLEDLTDLNTDLGWWWSVTDGEERFSVRVSFVGPFAVVLSAGKPVYDNRVCQILRDQGFILLSLAQMETRVSLWGPEDEAPLYEYLFCFDHGLPWDRRPLN